MDTDDRLPFDDRILLRLQGWLSPSFPVGAYTYSHALEQVIETGNLKTVEDLVARLTSLLRYGTGWNDGVLCRLALRAEDPLPLIRLAWSFQGTAELALESTQQGTAFVRALQQVWPTPEIEALREKAREEGIGICYPVAFGVAARTIGAPVRTAVGLYLMAFVHNLISAAVRAVPLGQTDGQRAVAILEPEVLAVAQRVLQADAGNLGSLTLAHEVASMNHETLFTRIFRS